MKEWLNLLGKSVCNICFFYQKLNKHREAIHSIDRLASFKCNRSRYETATKYMEGGRQQVQGQDPAIADEYQQRARRFHELAQAAE